MIILLLSLIVFLFILPVSVHAVCPICTVVVVGGLGISRWLGIDDVVTSVWIGGLILSSGFWFSNWIQKRKWPIPFPDITSLAIFYLLTIPSLYWGHFIGLKGNTLWGTDKVLLGTIIGSIAFLIGMGADKLLRKINHGHVYIYFQKVIMPVLMLALASLGLFLITS